MENFCAVKVLKRFRNDKLINNNVEDGLRVESPRTPRFYIQPKIHKEGNPGRSVISSLNCRTCKFPKHVDFYLQSIVKKNILVCQGHC